MTATSEKVEELIDDAKAIVADGDAYGAKARHPTTIHTRQTIEKLTTLLSSLNAQVEEMRKALGWRPIDSAPKDRTRVLLAWPHTPFVTIGVWQDRWIDGYGFPYAPPTHWHPLPATPTTEPQQ